MIDGTSKSPLTIHRKRAQSGSLRLRTFEILKVESSWMPADHVKQHAGFAGAALALMTWAWQLTHPASEPLPSTSSYENEDLLIKDVRSAVETGRAKVNRLPRVLVIGALGRCGRGAVDLCDRAGLSDIIVRSHSAITS